jgi:hypothetical protein
MGPNPLPPHTTHTHLPRCSHVMSSIGLSNNGEQNLKHTKKVIFFKRPFHLSNSKFSYKQRKWNRPNSISSSNATEHHKNLLLHKVIMLCASDKAQAKQQRTHVIQSWMSGDHSTTSDVTPRQPQFSPSYVMT